MVAVFYLSYVSNCILSGSFMLLLLDHLLPQDHLLKVCEEYIHQCPNKCDPNLNLKLSQVCPFKAWVVLGREGGGGGAIQFYHSHTDTYTHYIEYQIYRPRPPLRPLRQTLKKKGMFFKRAYSCYHLPFSSTYSSTTSIFINVIALTCFTTGKVT